MKPIIMPQVGQDVTQAKVVKWFKQVGDPIELGEPVCEVESDKAALEVEAEAEGVLLKILHFEGEKVDVFSPIAYVGAPDEAVPDDAPAPIESAPAAAMAPAEPASPSGITPPPPDGLIAASPAAKRLAREKGIDLATVAGTGPGGRITQEDVEAAIAKGTP